MYGFPFEPDIFDYDLPNVNKNNVNFSSTLMNIIRNNAGLVQAAGIDIKKLCSIGKNVYFLYNLKTFINLIFLFIIRWSRFPHFPSLDQM